MKRNLYGLLGESGARVCVCVCVCVPWVDSGRWSLLVDGVISWPSVPVCGVWGWMSGRVCVGWAQWFTTERRDTTCFAYEGWTYRCSRQLSRAYIFMDFTDFNQTTKRSVQYTSTSLLAIFEYKYYTQNSTLETTHCYTKFVPTPTSSTC